MTPEEQVAWDMYFAGVAEVKTAYSQEVTTDPETELSTCMYVVSKQNIAQWADIANAMLEERRKRFANPE